MGTSCLVNTHEKNSEEKVGWWKLDYDASLVKSWSDALRVLE